MSLFDDISRFGGKHCAIYIGARSIYSLALMSFKDTLSQSIGNNVQLTLPFTKPYAVRLESVNNFANSNDLSFIKIDTEFVREDGNVFLKTTDSLQFSFSLGILSNSDFETLTKLHLKLSHLRFQIEGSDEQLVCAPGTAELTPSFIRDSNFDEVICEHKLDVTEVAQVEGLLLYSGLAGAIRNSLASPQTVDLKRLFPGITFQGRIVLDISDDKKYLFVRGASGATRRTDSQCECADVGNGIGSVTAGSVKVLNSDASNQSDGNHDPYVKVTIGGPSIVKDPNSVLGIRKSGVGDNGLFMPNRMAKSLVDGPFPGVRLDVRNEGFIGWKAAAFIDFADFDFWSEPAQGRFVVKLKFRAEIYGSLHVDLGKLGKIRVTTFSGEQNSPSSNAVTISFYAVVGSGELFIKPVLEHVSFGDFDVHPRFFTLLGTPFGTKGAVVGFILDKILGELIARKIPIRLERELRVYMARVMFPIMDAYYSAELDGLQSGNAGNQALAALYDGNECTGFLFSSQIAG